jgi:hypothetical protein
VNSNIAFDLGGFELRHKLNLNGETERRKLRGGKTVDATVPVAGGRGVPLRLFPRAVLRRDAAITSTLESCFYNQCVSPGGKSSGVSSASVQNPFSYEHRASPTS